MAQKFRAKIHWINFAEGGRRMPPSKGTKYCPIIKFDNIMLKNAWSVCFICTGQEEGGIEIGFLSDEAPAMPLQKGNCFDLYEGGRKTARGEII